MAALKMGKYRHLPLTNQYINQLAVQFKTSTNPDMRRYERPHVNESGAEIPVWDLIYKMSRPNVQKILYKNVQLVCLS